MTGTAFAILAMFENFEPRSSARVTRPERLKAWNDKVKTPGVDDDPTVEEMQSARAEMENKYGKRNGKYNEWAKKMIKSHTRCIRRLYRTYNVKMIDKNPRASRNRSNKISRNKRNTMNRRREKFNIFMIVFVFIMMMNANVCGVCVMSVGS